MDRRLLILTYEFPPSGGGGVQRIAKFARYLPEHGWTPLVVSGRPVRGRALDSTLLADVADVRVERTPARHVATALARSLAPAKGLLRRRRTPKPAPASSPVTGVVSAQTHRLPVSSRLARWVAVPDDAAYWIGPAVRRAIALGREGRVAAVLASGPPHSVLIAGERVARRLGVPFVADMRDAWRDNPVAWWPTGAHEAASARAERRVLAAADLVLAVSPPIAEEAREMGAREVRLLPNGFDRRDLPSRAPDPAGPLRVVFMGKMYRGHSDPFAFLEGMAAAVREGADVLFDVVGTVSPDIPEAALKSGVGDRVVFHGYKPHREALALVAAADAGLVLIADRPGALASLTGKLFEYLGMSLPVIVAGPPEGEAARLVERAAAGAVVAPDDVSGVASLLSAWAREKRERGVVPVRPDTGIVAGYDRREQAGELARMLSELVAGS